MYAVLIVALATLVHLPSATSLNLASNLAPPSWTLARFAYQTSGLCLGMHLDPGQWFPCSGGAANSCSTELLPCTAPETVWNITGGYLCSAYEGPGGDNACIDVDCDSSEPGAVVKVIAGPTQWFSQLVFSTGQLVYTARSGMVRCLGLPTATTPATPPCNAGEEFLNNGTIIDYCVENSTQGWAMLPV